MKNSVGDVTKTCRFRQNNSKRKDVAVEERIGRVVCVFFFSFKCVSKAGLFLLLKNIDTSKPPTAQTRKPTINAAKNPQRTRIIDSHAADPNRMSIH